MVDGERLPGLPFFRQAQRVIHHNVCIGGDPFGMEHRLHQLALPLPEFTIAGKQAIAEVRPQHYFRGETFFVLIAVRHEDFLKKIGMAGEVKRIRAEFRPDEIAIAPNIKHERQRVAAPGR